MSEKIKIKPVEGVDFKEVEIETKDWNLETRKTINRLIRQGHLEKNGYCMFDACCDVLGMFTTLSEDAIFKLSKNEIEVIALQMADEINKKK